MSDGVSTAWRELKDRAAKLPEPGVKHDQEKPMLALLPMHGVVGVGRAMSYGAKKYGQHNYLGGIALTRLLSAALRHLAAYIMGEDCDSESGLSHLDHAGACILMAIEMKARKPHLDDRYHEESK